MSSRIIRQSRPQAASSRTSLATHAPRPQTRERVAAYAILDSTTSLLDQGTAFDQVGTTTSMRRRWPRPSEALDPGQAHPMSFWALFMAFCGCIALPRGWWRQYSATCGAWYICIPAGHAVHPSRAAGRHTPSWQPCRPLARRIQPWQQEQPAAAAAAGRWGRQRLCPARGAAAAGRRLSTRHAAGALQRASRQPGQPGA